jgi:hypothetical protein
VSIGCSRGDFGGIQRLFNVKNHVYAVLTGVEYTLLTPGLHHPASTRREFGRRPSTLSDREIVRHGKINSA